MNKIATDIRTYGAVAIGILLVIFNAIPAVNVPAGYQAVLAAVIAVLTALAQALQTKAVAAAKGPAK